jgi:oxygen-independent coproporphyrinogen-3 oxidase
VKVEISGIDMTQDVGPLIKSYYPKHEVEIKYIGDISETANIVTAKTNSEEKTEIYNDNEVSNIHTSGYEKTIKLSLAEDEISIFIDNIFRVSETFNYTDAPDPHMLYEKRKRRAYKNQLLRALFRVMSEETGRKLPWGILTGVRPTKLLFERLKNKTDLVFAVFVKFFLAQVSQIFAICDDLPRKI